MIGQIVSHYKILEHLGGGGMGVVYKAQDLKLDRPVALKFLPPELIRDPEAKERFIREAKAASALDHQNICVVHDIGEADDGQIYIVMAFYDGETLKKKIERGPLKIEEAVDIATQVALGLTKAHEHGIVHRDIKPANIMVTVDGVPKIVDFGLAKLIGRTMLTKEGSSLGTAAYMSPEQARGEPADKRTDVWAIGVVLYEMLTGRRPFEAEYENALMYSILNAQPEPITGLRTGVPIDLERVVSKCMAKAPTDRYQHVDELIVDLKHLSHEQSSLRRSPFEKPTLLRRRKRIIGIAIGLLILTGMGAATWWVLLRGGARVSSSREPRSIAVLPLAILGSGGEEKIFADGIHGEILNSLTKIKMLRVKAQTSVLQYRDTKKRVQDIADELGVDFLMEGSVHRAGDSIRVQAQLIDAKTEDHLWAETYDRPFTDILRIESSIAQSIASALNAVLTPRETVLLANKPTVNPEAYEYYLKGLYYWRIPVGTEGNENASEMFKKAISLDSNFALALAWLAKLEFTQGTLLVKPAPERISLGRWALDRARSIAPDLPEVHSAEACYFYYVEMDSGRAWREFAAALRDQENSSELLWQAGDFLLNQGAVETAQGYLTRSYDLDPTLNGARWANACALYLRRFEEAERWCSIMIEKDPTNGGSYYRKGLVAFFGSGDIEKAKRVLDEWIMTTGNRLEEDNLLLRFEIAYYSRDYKEALRLLSKSGGMHVQRSQMYSLLGEPARAREHLDSAIVEMTRRQRLEITWAELGLIYAMQGRRNEALKEMARALHPGAKIFNWGRTVERKVAEIWIVLGEHERAIDQLEYLLSVPSEVTNARLRLDPIYDPLRSNPRFQTLLTRSEQM
jgi:eukaryotic-like serine/threonine-protein kinase